MDRRYVQVPGDASSPQESSLSFLFFGVPGSGSTIESGFNPDPRDLKGVSKDEGRGDFRMVGRERTKVRIAVQRK